MPTGNTTHLCGFNHFIFLHGLHSGIWRFRAKDSRVIVHDLSDLRSVCIEEEAQLQDLFLAPSGVSDLNVN